MATPGSILLKFGLLYYLLLQPQPLQCTRSWFSDRSELDEDEARRLIHNFLVATAELSGKSTIDGDRECADSVLNWSLTPSPDAYLRTPQLIKKHGFPVETHHVTTEDGYILTLFRIPHGKPGAKSAYRLPAGARTSPAVFLHHGVVCSSAVWLMNPEEKSLPFLLANAGYDVWLGNSRGTTYSDTHVNLTKEHIDYWRFSWHEMGEYDVPATIDHILEVTGEPQLYYIGHSMGATTFFVTMDTHPEYNAKIRSMYALGPVAYLGNLGGLARLFAPFTAQEELLFDIFGGGQFLTESVRRRLNEVNPILCGVSPVGLALCGSFFFAISGFDPCQLNTTKQVSAIVGHVPDATSSRTIIHYLQLKTSKHFRRYDFGLKENMRKYGRTSPPDYDLSKVTAKVAVFWGQNDLVGAPRDVARLVRKLPNVVAYKRVAFDLWSHLDFIYGIDARTLVYDDVLRLMADHY